MKYKFRTVSEEGYIIRKDGMRMSPEEVTRELNWLADISYKLEELKAAMIRKGII